ncbi:MAG TPA: glycoside hydrolase family 3 C-terminal domain-containing protein, partial [bacterium]|nr:glycoside hydrolase family 3 C-terminal domain-containing protein [bacterium]
DTALTHILKVRMQLGMFDPPEMIPFTKIPPSVIGSKEHQELARQVSRESMVLLKNDKVGGVPLLPLNEKKLKKIAVVGPIAAILQFGDYSGTPVNEPVTILDGLKKRLGGRVEISNFEWRPAPEYTRFMPVPIPGIKAEYFTNGDMSGKPVAVRTEDSVNITPAGAPDQVRTGEAISARWKGVLKPDATGMYNLYIIARGEASLLVNGKEVFRTQPVVKKKPKMKTGVALDDEVYKAMTEKRRSAVVAFEAGKSYDIEVRYKLAKGEPMIRLEWVKPPAAPEAAREVEAIKSADVVIAVMGLKRDDEAEGMDRETLDLPNDQTEYLKQLVSLNKNVVAVLVHGSPLSINWMKEGMPAILEAWYPGEQGGNAVADVLFGDYNPAGRLTTTSFKSVDDLPSFDDHEVYNGRTYMYFKGEPLFPFGYGLSYSEFEYSGLKLDRASAAPGDVVNVVLNVKNKGPRDGDEVVQVYVRDLAPGENKPNKRLCGFKRVGIKNGATARVEIPVKISDLGYWNVERHRFEVEPGKYEIQVGASSADIRQTATMDVAGGPAK